MFGIGFSEFLIILIIAVIALGPEKLPGAIVTVAKYFKMIRSAVNEAKSSFESEIKLDELRKDAQNFKSDFTDMAQDTRKKLTFDDLQEVGNEILGGLNDNFSTTKSTNTNQNLDSNRPNSDQAQISNNSEKKDV
ncbi:MAG: Sec-independent protein translocase protein TatB [Campylobacter sp.]